LYILEAENLRQDDKMGIPLRSEHLHRYRQIAHLLMKYGRSDLIGELGLESTLSGGSAALTVPPEVKELASDLEAMGPTYVKLGQILSSRTDLLPPGYIEVLSRLQDDVAPFPVEDVERIIFLELGVRVSKIFRDFERRPLAAASLGQVHRATLRDGREVAVKVQRPDIRKTIATDLEIMADIAEFLEKHTDFGRQHGLMRVVDELRQTLMRELDYRKEAANMRRVHHNMRRFRRVVVAQPIDDFCSARVLTMEYIHGHKISEVNPVVTTEIDTAALADELFRAYLKQILVDGLVHLDPHPGNVLLTEDGRLGLLDLGMVAHVPPRMQAQLIRLLLAISEGRGEDAADIAAKIGHKTDAFDQAVMRDRITQLVTEYQGATISQMDIGGLIMRIGQISGETGILVPPQLTMLGKALLHLDEVGKLLDPDFDPNAAIRHNASRLLQQRLRRTLSLGSVYNAILETNEFLQQLPARLNEILTLISRNELSINVDAIDETRLIKGMQKIANRITMGLILAALIVGAALMMRVETNWELLGYPGLAILLFMGAASGGVLLLLEIVFSDRKDNRGR